MIGLHLGQRQGNAAMPLPLLLIPLTLALMWVLLIRPQQQRARAHQELVENLQVGTEIMTTAGLYGRLVELETDTAVLEVAPGTRIKIARASVGTVVGSPPGAPAPPTAETSVSEEA
jgi:preprotein translocase subunit YajC